MKVHLARSSFWERYVDWRNVQSWEVEKVER
jgi:hypothetical protein